MTPETWTNAPPVPAPPGRRAGAAAPGGGVSEFWLIADLFCGAGGAAMGVHYAMEEAGLRHEIVGFDISPQPRYPFSFVQADAMTVDLGGFDAVWASPPCKRYSLAAQQWRKRGSEYPDLIAPTRAMLTDAGLPWVMENVPGAPLANPLELNGASFCLLIRRTRWFEASFPLEFRLLRPEGRSNFRMSRPARDNEPLTPVGHFSGVSLARQRMGIDWMTGRELSQAMPPAYSRYVWGQLIRAAAWTA